LYNIGITSCQKGKIIDRWKKQHKEIRFYLKKEDYEILEKLASKHNMTVKDFVLKFINDVKAAAEGEYDGVIMMLLRSS